MRRVRALALWAAVPLCALVGLGALAGRTEPLALVNESPSLPRGLYVRDPAARPDRGAVVAFAQPQRVRPYLRRLGMPADVRLIKRVAAVGGDAVCSDGRRLRSPTGGVPVLARDRQGTTLPAWRDCRRLRSDERLVLGDTINSFDSRYFGPVPVHRIDGVYRRVMSW